MTKNYLCISIPEELQQFSKLVDILENDSGQESMYGDFGVKTIKDESGFIVGTAYYSDSGELIKKVLYKGTSVDHIEHYRNNTLYANEKYDSGRLLRKTLYTPSGKECSVLNYKYSNLGQIVGIHKMMNKVKYAVEYGYDELSRVNRRVLLINNKVINDQKYKYDMLDRIIEYKDLNQTINVHKVNQKNELVSYSITDVIGNRIIINNKFMCSEYIGTDIELNEHKTTVKDISYVNNIMLKKPYTTEEDLYYALSYLTQIPRIHSPEIMSTRREPSIKSDEISNYIINNKKESGPPQIISAKNINLMKL